MIVGVAFLGLLLAAQTAPANKTIQHIVGSVAAIDQKHIEVLAPNKKTAVSVTLSKQVRYKNKTNPASTAPPAVGDRVIIEASKENKTLTALVVHYSPMRQGAAAPQ